MLTDRQTNRQTQTDTIYHPRCAGGKTHDAVFGNRAPAGNLTALSRLISKVDWNLCLCVIEQGPLSLNTSRRATPLEA